MPKVEPRAERLEGTRAGVTATPASFTNGRLLAGAQPLERFMQMIEDELAQGRRPVGLVLP